MGGVGGGEGVVGWGISKGFAEGAACEIYLSCYNLFLIL